MPKDRYWRERRLCVRQSWVAKRSEHAGHRHEQPAYDALAIRHGREVGMVAKRAFRSDTMPARSVPRLEAKH